MNGNRTLNVELVEVGSVSEGHCRHHDNSKRGPCDTASRLTATWFWLTLLGTFYYGYHHVLPLLYDTFSILLPFQRAFAIFMLCQILINWLCVRFVSSSYQPEVVGRLFRRPQVDYSPPSERRRLFEGGIEIDLAQLRASKHENGSTGNGVETNGHSSSIYSLPITGVRSLEEREDGAELRWKRGDTIYVVGNCDAMTDDGRPSNRRRVFYPYWSWKPCHVCRHRRPPRAHHCRRCGTCVLKRDHHCLLVGRCVGARNQRHFVVFVVWSTIALAFSLAHGTIYAFTQFVPRNTVWDLLLPVAVVRACVGSVRPLDVALVLAFYSLGWFAIMSVRFTVEQFRVIQRGVTSFEDEHQIKVMNFNSVRDNIRGVFGDRLWLLNFLVPLHCVFPAADNGIEWPNIKA